MNTFLINQVVYGTVPATSVNTDYTITIPITIPDGYKILGIGAISNRHYSQSLSFVRWTTNSVVIEFHNMLGAPIGQYSNAVRVEVLLIRTSF